MTLVIRTYDELYKFGVEVKKNSTAQIFEFAS